jgi:hypothetical protein
MQPQPERAYLGVSTSTGALYLERIFLLCAIATPATWAQTDPRLPIADHTYGDIVDMVVIPVTGQNSEQSPPQLGVSALLTFLPRSVLPGQVHATQEPMKQVWSNLRIIL